MTQTLKEKNVQPSSLKFGFLGLGIMGSGIVKNLLNSGHKVIVWNRTTEKVNQKQRQIPQRLSLFNSFSSHRLCSGSCSGLRFHSLISNLLDAVLSLEGPAKSDLIHGLRRPWFITFSAGVRRGVALDVYFTRFSPET